ncbi:MAG: glutamate-5-semialdehyde dehydrogenase [Phycisphaeraceae bacterium]|nr:glutamate-5-semialdehyde dehydrogenase [Phycisphaeraceae bacterium]
MSGVRAAAERARAASRALQSLPTARKDALLRDLAGLLRARSAEVLRANALDVEAATAAGLAPAKLRRLTLDGRGIEQLAAGIEQVAMLPDPVGRVTDDRQVASGLRVRRVRIPLGVIAMIYESRPGVTLDAFALCFKSGNAVLLKGGREAQQSNAAMASLAREALERSGLAGEGLAGAMTDLTPISREEVWEMLTLSDLIDLVIPRGGEELIRAVVERSRIPTIQHFKGVCHVYVHESADLDRAIKVCVTAKTSAPATCNAAECVLVDRAIAAKFVPRLIAAMRRAGVEVRADAESMRLAWSDDGDLGLRLAEEGDYGHEFLDTVVAVRIVEGVTGPGSAVEHVARYGSNHTEAILAHDPAAIRAFVEGVPSSCVAVNASTRFNDGFQLGLGAEIGISTSRLHAYGPMGLEELTIGRFVVEGDYHTR